MADEEELITKVRPTPELVRGMGWSVHHADRVGRTQMDPKRHAARMAVDHRPESSIAKQSRMHEMGHARFSPDEMPHFEDELEEKLYGAFEDLRIDQLLCARGFRQRDFTDKEMVKFHELVAEADKMSADRDTKIMKYIGSGIFHDKVRNTWRPVAEEALITEFGDKTTWTIMKIIQDYEKYVRDRPMDESAPAEVARRLAKLLRFQEEDLDNDTEDERVEENFSPESLSRIMKKMVMEEGAGPEWGEVVHVKSPMKKGPNRVSGRKMRASEYGAFPRYWNRYCSDGMVFAERRRVPGGPFNILLDASGSMRVTMDDIWALMEASPGCRIYCYRGDGGGRGTLQLLAEDGWHIKNKEDIKAGGGNCIDGPALEHIAQFKGPKIWVSDGQVTSKDEQFEYALIRECRAICKQHKIRRIEDIPTAIDYIRENVIRR